MCRKLKVNLFDLNQTFVNNITVPTEFRFKRSGFC